MYCAISLNILFQYSSTNINLFNVRGGILEVAARIYRYFLTRLTLKGKNRSN